MLDNDVGQTFTVHEAMHNGFEQRGFEQYFNGGYKENNCSGIMLSLRKPLAFLNCINSGAHDRRIGNIEGPKTFLRELTNCLSFVLGIEFVPYLVVHLIAGGI